MIKISSKGKDLAIALNPSIGTLTNEVLSTCSAICRAAATYQRLQEEACNGYRDEARAKSCQARERKLETRIAALCLQLPTVQAKGITPVFSGDPRGACVKLRMPDGRTNDWGQEGICVP